MDVADAVVEERKVETQRGLNDGSSQGKHFDVSAETMPFQLFEDLYVSLFDHLLWEGA